MKAFMTNLMAFSNLRAGSGSGLQRAGRSQPATTEGFDDGKKGRHIEATSRTDSPGRALPAAFRARRDLKPKNGPKL